MTTTNVEVVETSSEVTVLRLHGDFDISSSPDQLAAVDQIMGNADLRHLVIDAADVTFIDSSGLRDLLTTVVALRDRGVTVSTTGASPRFVRLLELGRLNETFGWCQST